MLIVFCNEKVRENYYRIPVITDNLFRFDFFSLLKGLRTGVWKIRDIVKGGKNPTDIGNQVQFIDTIKYFQQSLSSLTSSLTCSEKEAIWKACKNYLMKDPNLSKKFPFFTKEEKKWVLEYLSSGKGTIPYELISDFDSLSIAPDDEFFKPHQLYSSMKDSVFVRR